MSRHGERALFGLLLEEDSIEVLVRERFSSDLIPTPELRPIYDWAIHYWQVSTPQGAPTLMAFKSTELPGHGGKMMSDVLHEYEIPLDAPEESVQWIIEDLRSQHLMGHVGNILKACAFNITEVPADEILEPLDALIASAGKLREEYGAGPEAEAMRPYSAKELADMELHFEWLVNGFWAHPSYGMLGGQYKSLKSYLAYFLAISVASGEPLFGQFEVPEAKPVMIYVGEGGQVACVERLTRISSAMGLNFGDLPIHCIFDIAPVAGSKFQTSLRNTLRDFEPGLVIIDPWYTYHGSDVNAANLHQEGDLLNMVSGPCTTAGASLVIVNHFNKTGKGSGLNRITMSGGAEQSDSWVLVTHRNTPTPVDVEQGSFHLNLEVGTRLNTTRHWNLDIDVGQRDEHNATVFTKPITWEIEQGDGLSTTNGGVRQSNLDRSALTRMGIQMQIRDILTTHPFQMSMTQVKGIVGGNTNAFREAWYELVESGEIVSRGDGPHKTWGLS